MNEVTEFTGGEKCTATVHQTCDDGMTYVGPLHIGFYSDSTEVWIEQEGKRIGIEGENLSAVIKQLKRAHAMAKETSNAS